MTEPKPYTFYIVEVKSTVNDRWLELSNCVDLLTASKKAIALRNNGFRETRIRQVENVYVKEIEQ